MDASKELKKTKGGRNPVDAGKLRTLVIGEKPSVARDIARVLEADTKDGDVYIGTDYVVTSALGHLVSLPMPEDIDASLRRWSLQTLPIVPAKFALKPGEGSEKRLQMLKKWLFSEEIGEVINACDAGREGELIFTYIYEFCRCKKPFRRLWMVSMTTEGIRSAFASLRPAESMISLQDAARCRSEADWLVGINGTRAVTARTSGWGKDVSTVGRVQTPTLTLVVERDRAIRNFVSEPYWRIVGQFAVGNGTYEGVFSDGKGGDRIFDRARAEQIFAATRQISHGTVTDKKKRTKQSPPRLYDLTTLQREANTRFHYSAASTLQIAQALYEQHKLITYPRTDSKALPEDYGETCRKTLEILGEPYNTLAQKILNGGWIRQSDKKIFNNKDVSDHFAIIPTPQKSRQLREDESRVYDMIVRRFIAVFFPQAEYDVTQRITELETHPFVSEGKVLAVAGYLEVYDRSAEESKGTLPALCAADGVPPQAKVDEINLSEEETRPPAHYTEATLLSAMEAAGKFVEDEELAAAMKDRGLGTPATRAQILENLIGTGYLIRSEQRDRSLLATPKAERLLDFLSAAKIEVLKDPAMTGEWEFKLREIEQGRFTRGKFMDEIIGLTRSMTECIKTFDETDASCCTASHLRSPMDGQPLIETFRSYCTVDRSVTIAKVIGGRELSDDEILELMKKGRIGPFENFKARSGRPFKASVIISDGKAKLEFDQPDREQSDQLKRTLEDISYNQALCDCPLGCGGKVYDTDVGYLCENLKDKKCTFRLSRALLGHKLTAEEVSSLIQTGKTPLIGDFVSNRTQKQFSAFLVLEKNGRVGFSFPPRTAQTKKRGNPTTATAEEETSTS
ncbi:MAG: DNA topoisomerase 3 [Puniceicoccales bacterium]|jgi:DNA topoisomerase-3|nr:DNA topoisomerase 3 [Puniceicoccales bacterium]